MSKRNLDSFTLQLLIKEATKNYKKAQKLFEKYDNSDDMQEAAIWRLTANWLNKKLKNEGML